jgi:hypothetical protein
MTWTICIVGASDGKSQLCRRCGTPTSHPLLSSVSRANTGEFRAFQSHFRLEVSAQSGHAVCRKVPADFSPWWHVARRGERTVSGVFLRGRLEKTGAQFRARNGLLQGDDSSSPTSFCRRRDRPGILMDVHPVLRGISDVWRHQLTSSAPNGQPPESSYLAINDVGGERGRTGQPPR